MQKTSPLWRQKVSTFVAGVLLVVLMLFFFDRWPNLKYFGGSVSFGPWLEESLKFITILILIRLVSLKTIMIPLLGAGFGLIEAFNRYFDRGIKSVILFFVHFILGIIMAFFFYLAIKSKHIFWKGTWYMLAYLVPAGIHLGYNILAITLKF